MIEYSYKSWNRGLILLLLVLFFTNTGDGYAQSSTNYIIKKSVISQGGTSSESANYRVFDTVGQTSAVGSAASTNYGASAGFFGDGGIVTDVVNKEETTIPVKFGLCQNYPNPFNPETTIRFDVKEPCRVLLKVYNIMGQQVADLVNEEYSSGRYEVNFNATGFSSGLYFYKISMGNFQSVKKMVILE